MGQGAVFKYTGTTYICYKVAFVSRAAPLRGSQGLLNAADTQQGNSQKSFIYLSILLEDTNCPLKD